MARRPAPSRDATARLAVSRPQRARTDLDASAQPHRYKPAEASGIQKRVSPRTLRHRFAAHLFEQDVDIRVIQVLLGHAKLDTTALNARVATKTIRAVTSPIEALKLRRLEAQSYRLQDIGQRPGLCDAYIDLRSAGPASSSLNFPQPVRRRRIGAAFSSSRRRNSKSLVSGLSLKSGSRSSSDSRISRLVKSVRPSRKISNVLHRAYFAQILSQGGGTRWSASRSGVEPHFQLGFCLRDAVRGADYRRRHAHVAAGLVAWFGNQAVSS